AVTVSDRICGASFDAVAAEDAPGIVDVIDAGVAFSRGNSLRVGIFRGLDINTIRGTGCSAEKTTYAFFEAVFVSLQDVDSAITRLDAGGDVGISLRGRLLEHGAKGDGEALSERHKDRAHFIDD